MAVSIITQPYLYSSDIIYARSPVVYGFSGCVASAFTYKFILYCSTGTTSDLTTIYASIDRIPDTNGCITVDASMLIRNYIKNNYNISYTGNYLTYFTARLVEYINNGVNAETNTNISIASLGYINDASGGFNDDEEVGEYIVSYIPITNEIYIPTFLSYTLRYKNVDSAGYSITYTDLISGSTTITEFWAAEVYAADRIKNIKCGYYDIYTDYGRVNIDQSKPIQILISGTTYTIYPFPCLEDLYPVDFININGVLDTIYFIGRGTTTDMIEYETYKYNKVNYQTATYNSASGSYHKLFTNGKIKLVLNTGWIDEDYNLKLEQLFLSEYCWIYGKPYLVTDKEMTFKTNRYDRMINYTITFERGYDRINNVY